MNIRTVLIIYNCIYATPAMIHIIAENIYRFFASMIKISSSQLDRSIKIHNLKLIVILFFLSIFYKL